MGKQPSKPQTNEVARAVDDMHLDMFLVHLRQLCNLYEVCIGASVTDGEPRLVIQRGKTERSVRGV